LSVEGALFSTLLRIEAHSEFIVSSASYVSSVSSLLCFQGACEQEFSPDSGFLRREVGFIQWNAFLVQLKGSAFSVEREALFVDLSRYNIL